MKFTAQRKLSRDEQAAVRALLARAKEKEPFSMNFPLDEPETQFFTARGGEGEGEILSVLALMSLGEGEFELSALTDPPFRGRGLFHALWQRAKRALPKKNGAGKPARVCAALDPACRDALPLLRSLGAVLSSEELELRCELPERQRPGGVCLLKQSAPEEGGLRLEALSPDGKSALMECFAMPLGDGRCYLHRISVREELRGSGVGSRIFPELLGALTRLGYRSALLQVSASNLPALRLYRNNGFFTVSALRYYELPL